ncbi:MAG TPA: alkaline phosphatase D family protein [Thermoanaerobaculia bacterium]|nr:alkaline phosphatase D family protein [Thermoanaerobaculia bacterium]
MTRRGFLAAAAAMGASAAWAGPRAARSRSKWTERRDLFAEGVASGDPGHDSVLLWTRVSSPSSAAAVALLVEVAEDSAFTRVVATSRARALAEADHTCRVLVGGLEPSREYWYRFIDESGRGSRAGRTVTAPAPGDWRPLKFAFVSCQNPCEGALNAYRRMIHEDERAAPSERLAFVLHLGDFIYEVVDYPEERPGGRRYDRRLRDLIRFPQGEKVLTFHVPVTVEDYRTVYRAYLHDPDLQDARARFPFVNMWDNHEFSWLGWQSLQQFAGKVRPAQTRKVAANQAWFEYQPARVRQKSETSLERFDAPRVEDIPVERFDEHGLGTEPGNLAAVRSLTGYRSLTFGKHVELLITDQHSYRSEEPSLRAEAQPLASDDFPEMLPEETMAILDAGRTHADGHPPDALPSAGAPVRNFRKDGPPQTILGAEQKAWFLGRLRASRATWKIWGNSEGTLDWRADPQNLPEGTGKKWPGAGYASFGGGGDYGTAYTERGEIYDAVSGAGITGFVTVSGDRHSFWAGLAAKALPPAPFAPVGAAFITGSISAPGLVEAYEHRFPKEHPLRALYLADIAGGVQPAINLLMHHGVRSCLEYRRTGDVESARRASNPDLAPHLAFLDMGGHGYATLRVTGDAAECEFVCIPRPLERSASVDGGPLRYRVVHRVALWKDGERPALSRRVVEGDPGLSL